jgi:hypothetical protein
MQLNPVSSVNHQLFTIGAPPLPAGYTIETLPDCFIVRAPNGAIGFFPRGKAKTRNEIRAAAIMLRTRC